MNFKSAANITSLNLSIVVSFIGVPRNISRLVYHGGFRINVCTNTRGSLRIVAHLASGEEETAEIQARTVRIVETFLYLYLNLTISSRKSPRRFYRALDSETDRNCHGDL